MSEILDIVNAQDEIIGQADRDEVHRTGLLCRLVYVCFYTPNGEIILQRRGMAKKNDPGKLTTTVSGHVGSGQNYIDAAIRETYEETGIKPARDALTNLGVIRADYVQGTYLSYAMRGFFAYKFTGTIDDLIVEDGDGAGFVSLPIDELSTRVQKFPNEFAIVLATEPGKKLMQDIRHLTA